MGRKEKISQNRAEDFQRYYEDVFGPRWPALRAALLAAGGHYELNQGLAKTYYLDEASVIAARYLEAEPAERILDMCAAPGGKSLVILSEIIAQDPAASLHYTANERSAARRARLKQVLSDHLPPELSEQITVTGHDAGLWGTHERDAYQRIFLDVPCSSERHVLSSAKHLQQWSPSRIKRLAQQSYSFLLSALTALAPGGTLVYATCALSPEENDRVIERTLSRVHKKGEFSAITDNRRRSDRQNLPDWVEDQRLGFAVLPDRADGRGPMYFSRIKKF